MKFNNVYIEAMACAEPDVFLSSEDLESRLAPVYNRLKLPFGRLELSTGIKSRGYFDSLRPSGISIKAAKAALKQADIPSEKIDLLVHSSVCRDFLEPSTASVVHNGLGLSQACRSYDMSNACLGFLDAMFSAACQIEAGQISTALIVTGENSKPLIENTVSFLNGNLELTRKSVKKYFANLTIGSAGVAYIMTNQPRNPLAKYMGSAALCDTSRVELCQGDGNVDSLMMETDSEELLHAGIALAKNCYELFKQNVFESPDWVAPHQVGLTHRNLLMERLGLDRNIDFSTCEEYGNTGSAACPLTLLKAFKSGRLQKDDKIGLLGIGSGLHSNMAGVVWQ